MKNIDLNKLINWQAFFDEFNNESARGMVIIAYANLEAYLQKVIENYLMKNPSVIDGLLNNNLSTFLNKNKLAYDLKIIRKSVFHDLDIVRRIRNAFAHEMYGLTFEDQKIILLCDQLIVGKISENPFTQTPENKFRFSCFYLLAELDSTLVKLLKGYE